MCRPMMAPHLAPTKPGRRRHPPISRLVTHRFDARRQRKRHIGRLLTLGKVPGMPCRAAPGARWKGIRPGLTACAARSRSRGGSESTLGWLAPRDRNKALTALGPSWAGPSGGAEAAVLLVGVPLKPPWRAAAPCHTKRRRSSNRSLVDRGTARQVSRGIPTMLLAPSRPPFWGRCRRSDLLVPLFRRLHRESYVCSLWGRGRVSHRCPWRPARARSASALV
jgi:hypothetical protein